ncbi:aminotransferase A [Bacillus thermotolerans]|uniref:Aminotransferase n=1 Tax=Bacillus thermotolerans TaxID=1221996 RepID=A0A0F5I112_BACTR|nr:aminotransferase A [Bacillus thermotolerans]KKB39173.1 N-acetyl-L,L-diaminopimelate aminotransferase [Bacillus thermotolerans]KKB42565.1 N-acetyl-L,L-diaminopimelate aminotransferase [Bacillus thermotolerans]KKB42650.1 N-acetyl-L,L-diaminopimelate aminotransferase [Bacillus thermotolerans]
MEHLINKQVKNLQISGIRKFFNLVSHMDDMISLTIGQPDFLTPEHVKAAGAQAIADNYTTYTHNAGFLDVRKAAAEYVHKKYNLSYAPESEVIVTVGASQAIDITLRTLLSPGDEVILPGPVYPGYEPVIDMCQAHAQLVDTRDNGFKLTADLISEALTERTKVLILPYPSNPTGVSLSKEELKEIADLLRGKDVFVIADEIYSELTFDTDHVSIASFLREQTIVLNGLSKSHAMTGWRIGFLFAPETLAKHILKVHQYNVSCAPSISQRAALEAVSAGQNDAQPMRNEYKKRRDYMLERLSHMGVHTEKPDGAFYIFAKTPSWISDSSFDFCHKLAMEKKVAVVPGSAFSIYGEGYFRLSFACSMENIEKGMDRLEAYLNEQRTALG